MTFTENNYSTISPSLQRLSVEETDWIRYKLKRAKLRYADVAAKAGVPISAVKLVMTSRTANLKVYNTLWTSLGYKSFAEMRSDARRCA